MKKISVVTPSFNQGSYIEDTIKSVVFQNDKNLEYIIMDGGSTDNTVDIIKRYSCHISSWVSKKDYGQAWAINQGFHDSNGDILCWLNSDDMYFPNTLSVVREMFNDIEEPTIIFGNCLHFNPNDRWTMGSDVINSYKKNSINLIDYIIQPSTFWNRKAWDIVGELDESLNFTFDWDWFIRASNKGVRFIPVQNYLSIYRVHEMNKTGKGGDNRINEIINILNRYNEIRISEAFLEMRDKKIPKTKKILKRLRVHRLMDLDHIIHKLYFRKLSFYEFDNLRIMG